MRIGVLADTHIPARAKTLPEQVYGVFSGVDRIIHAGDIVDKSVLDELETIAPVSAVFGNRDTEALKQWLPETLILELHGFRIGVFHGHGDKGTTMQRLPGFFPGAALDCVLFGHSHIPYMEKRNGVLYFNPGSPTVRKHQKYGSVGILTLGSSIEAELIYLKGS